MAESVSFRKCRCFEWKVRNLTSVGRLVSPVFGFNGSQCCRLRLEMRADGYLSVYFHVNSEDTVFPETWISISIKDNNGRLQLTSSYDIWHSRVSIRKEYARNLLEKNLSKNGVVTFVCILMAPNSSYNANETGNKALQTPPKSLAVDLHQLLDDATYSDITLKCGDETIPAHRNILSARSKVLAAMLRADMIENRSRVIVISDMNPPVLNEMVQFIYTGKLSTNISMDIVPELYEAGDKYDVESLKRHCSDFMNLNLTVRNVCSILVLADAHSDAELKECAVAYIMKNKVVRNDVIWLKFCKEHPVLANEILTLVYKEHECFK